MLRARASSRRLQPATRPGAVSPQTGWSRPPLEPAVVDLYPASLPHRYLGCIPHVVHLQLIAETRREIGARMDGRGEGMPGLSHGKRRAAVLDAGDVAMFFGRWNLPELAQQQFGRRRL